MKINIALFVLATVCWLHVIESSRFFGLNLLNSGKEKARVEHKSAIQAKPFRMRTLPTRLLNQISNIEHQSSKQVVSLVPSIFRNNPVFLNSAIVAWTLASSYSLISIITRIKNNPGESYNEIFEVDGKELNSWMKQSFPTAPPLRKLFGLVVPVLRVCQFVECVLYPEDDNGKSWSRLVKNWWNRN